MLLRREWQSNIAKRDIKRYNELLVFGGSLRPMMNILVIPVVIQELLQSFTCPPCSWYGVKPEGQYTWNVRRATPGILRATRTSQPRWNFKGKS